MKKNKISEILFKNSYFFYPGMIKVIIDYNIKAKKELEATQKKHIVDVQKSMSEVNNIKTVKI